MIDPKKIKEAWRVFATYGAVDYRERDIWDAYVEAEARARMWEFRATAFEYYDHEDNFISSRPIDVTDPRHNRILADWVAEVKSELRE